MNGSKGPPALCGCGQTPLFCLIRATRYPSAQTPKQENTCAHGPWSRTGSRCKEIELPTPEPKGTEVLLEVTHCGVCHSDLHIWEGYYDVGGGQKMSLVDRGVTLPLAMGHEIVGRVVKLGPDAKGVKVGDLRIVFPWLGCGTCEKCLAEDDNMCAVAARSLGVYPNGGYGTHVIAPHPRHLVDPGTLDPAVAATYACSGITVYSAIKKAMPLTPTQAIVLVGAGGLGLNAIAVLKALKHQNIISVDISAGKARSGAEGRRAQGGGRQRRGPGRSPSASSEAAGGPVLAVIDLVNGTATARFAFGALRKGGKLIQVGLFGGELMLPLPIMAIRALTVQGSYVGNPKELRELVKLAQDGDASGAAGRHGAAEPGLRRADAPARRQGHRPAGPEGGGAWHERRRSPHARSS